LSTRTGAKVRRKALEDSLMFAGREYSTAALMLHHAVADRLGLSVTDLKTLDILQRVGAVTAGEIASHTHLATASVTNLIDRLERKRFVRRARDPKDRRRVVVELTPTFGKKVAPLFESLGRRMMTRFSTYRSSDIEIIRGFLMCGADEMRDEAKKI
jgi:DNA-binding MarR family transcriptional regulator